MKERKIVARQPSWAHPMPNAWHCTVLGASLQILQRQDGEFEIIADRKFGHPDPIEKLEQMRPTSLQSAKEACHIFLTAVLNGLVEHEELGIAEG